MKLYIMRHGDTVWNKERRLQGGADIPLSESGKELAKITGEAIKDLEIDVCIASPLGRAKETAKLVLGDRKIPIYIDDRIREISFGDYEGLKFSLGEDSEIPDPDFKNFFLDPENYKVHPSAESIEKVCQRTREFMDDLAASEDYRDKSILLVTHGCCSRALLRCVEEKTKNFWRGKTPPNCSISTVEFIEGKYHLVDEDRIYYDESRIIRYVE
ncbi:MAG TPA: histidine phosphatase family protein [Lachnospiraceae bacterium]